MRAQKGISQYLEIMALISTVNVARNRDFQRKYNYFYRVMKKPRAWSKEYYSYMQKSKKRKTTFDQTLDHFKKTVGTCEASFSSKLVATFNPTLPVWDKFVLKNTGAKKPSNVSKRKMEQTKKAYSEIQAWYKWYLNSRNGKLVIRLFKKMVPEHAQITDLKKVDFVLWQTRPKKS